MSDVVDCPSARDLIQELEDRMLELPQVDLPVAHYFSDGLYAREIRIPAGVMLTGAIHLHEHLNIVSQGTIEVVTEDGSDIITAPATLVSRPGTKRVGFAITDVVWTTVHANPGNERDIPTLERMLVVSRHDLLSSEDAARIGG